MIRRRELIVAGSWGAAALIFPSWARAQSGDPLAGVDPEFRAVAAAILRGQAAQDAMARSAVVAHPPPIPEGVEEQRIPGAAAGPPVTIYVINAGSGAGAPRGAILYLHGGGFIGGDARDNLRALRSLAGRLDCVVVSVQYRLAPATRFPGALEDNYAALKWLRTQASELGVDPARIAVMGGSAGGGHAAMLTIAARDRGEIPVAFQALVYPMLDDRTGSSRPAAPGVGKLIWRADDNRRGWAALLGQPAGARRAPAGSVPSRTADLTRLPPTFIGVGSLDLFAEEDIEFARRLVAAGVPTEMLLVPGVFHGFELIAPNATVSRQFTAALEAALRRALSVDRPG